MGRASSSKKVSRAASTGGGRTARGARPLGWYAAIAMVVLLGFAGIIFSRQERRTELAAGTTPPIANKDHWHAAVGFFLCDSFAPNITDERDPKGIHTHGDGVIHIHPFVRSSAGRNATLGQFADAVRMTLSDTEIKLPGGKAFKEGSTKCSGKAGIVQVKVEGKDGVITENIRSIRLTDAMLLTVAFAPKGAELPPPPSASQLSNLEDVGTPSTIPGTGGTTPPPADGSSTTSPPADASTTTAAP
jgi:hypothetical protein